MLVERKEHKWVSCLIALLVCCMILFSSVSYADGDSIQLPNSLISIEGDAFGGVQVSDVTVPSGMTTAFRDAFPDAVQDVWVHCDPGEKASSMLSEGLDVDADTVYRALIINQEYVNAGENRLYGTGNDASAVSSLLSELDNTEYRISRQSNLSVDEICSAVQSVFGDATDYDVSLLYYSGHGSTGGSLVGCVNGRLSGLLTPQELSSAMQGIKGRKVIIVDACYSGGIVDEIDGNSSSGLEPVSVPAGGGRGVSSVLNSRGADPESIELSDDQEEEPVSKQELEDFTSDFMSAFSSGSRLRKTGASNGFSSYYIMAAATVDELSWELWDSTSMGVFTYSLCKGFKPDSSGKPADANANGVITFGEAFSYAQREVLEMTSTLISQHAQSSSGGIYAFSPFR